MTRAPAPHILIAGGGVAAVETVIALRALAEPRPQITLLTPERQLVQRPAAVAAPFGFGPPPALPLEQVRRHARFELRTGSLAAVDARSHQARTADGERIPYDSLVVAVGARPQAAVRGAITFSGPDDAAAVAAAVAGGQDVAFVVPRATSWSLPAYELAIMAAVELRGSGREQAI